MKTRTKTIIAGIVILLMLIGTIITVIFLSNRGGNGEPETEITITVTPSSTKTKNDQPSSTMTYPTQDPTKVGTEPTDKPMEEPIEPESMYSMTRTLTNLVECTTGKWSVQSPAWQPDSEIRVQMTLCAEPRIEILVDEDPRVKLNRDYFASHAQMGLFKDAYIIYNEETFAMITTDRKIADEVSAFWAKKGHIQICDYGLNGVGECY